MRLLKYFPYKPRRYQKEVIEFIANYITDHNVCLHAATGFGKTPVILAALLNLSRRFGYQIIWAVRTGNETDRPIEELKEIERKTKARFFGLSFRGKRDMCLLARDRNLADYESVSYLCEKMRSSCPYYLNLQNARIPIPKEPLLYSEILDLGRNFHVCPYFLQRRFLEFADLVSLSYNYVLSPIGWSIRRSFPFRNSILVIDEAHNLQFAIMNLNSDAITTNSVARAINELNTFGTAKASELLVKLKRLHLEMIKIGEKIKGESLFDPIELFYNANITRKDIESIRRYGSLIRSKLLSEGKTPRSSLYHLANYIEDVIEIYGTEGITFLVYKEKNNVYFEKWDMRSSEVLREIWPTFISSIFCSGTLIPIDAFADTIGLENYQAKVIPSFYSLFRIKTLILRDVTTRGETLPENMIAKYDEAIRFFIANTKTNAAIFSASYRIQNDLLPSIESISKEMDKPIFIEYEGMSGDEGRRILDSFKASAYTNNPGILVATMTGRFAEGADFPGIELENVFLVGIPFDKVTLRTKVYIEYYQKIYGKERGGFYAYIVPAFRRASQALGRVIRSETDRALFVLGDRRFSNPRFFALLPDYIKETAIEIESHDLPKEIYEYYIFQEKCERHLEIIRHAIKNKKILEILYESRIQGLAWRKIKPIEINSRYLIALDTNSMKEKKYRIDKIRDIKKMEK